MLHYILHNKKSRHLLLTALLCSTTFSLPTYASNDLADSDEDSAQKHSSILPNKVRRGVLAVLNEEDAHPSPKKPESTSENQLALSSGYNFSIFGDLLNGLRNRTPNISDLWSHAPSMKSIKDNAQDALLFILNEEKDDQTPQKGERVVDPEHNDSKDTTDTHAPSTALENPNLEAVDGDEEEPAPSKKKMSKKEKKNREKKKASQSSSSNVDDDVVPTEDNPDLSNPADRGSKLVDDSDDKSGTKLKTDGEARETEFDAPDQESHKQGNPALNLQTNESFIDPEEGEVQSPTPADNGHKSEEDDAGGSGDVEAKSSDVDGDSIKDDEQSSSGDHANSEGDAVSNQSSEGEEDSEKNDDSEQDGDSGSGEGASCDEEGDSDSDEGGSNPGSGEGDSDSEEGGSNSGSGEGDSDSDEGGSNSGSGEGDSGAEDGDSRSGEDSDVSEEIDEQRTPHQSPYSTPKKTRTQVDPSTPEAHGYNKKTTTPTHGNIYHDLQYTYENPQGREVTVAGGRFAYILGNSPHPSKFKLKSADSPKKAKRQFHLSYEKKYNKPNK